MAQTTRLVSFGPFFSLLPIQIPFNDLQRFAKFKTVGLSKLHYIIFMDLENFDVWRRLAVTGSTPSTFYLFFLRTAFLCPSLLQYNGAAYYQQCYCGLFRWKWRHRHPWARRWWSFWILGNNYFTSQLTLGVQRCQFPDAVARHERTLNQTCQDKPGCRQVPSICFHRS